MRHRNVRKLYQQFMFGVIGMAIVVMLVVALFFYWCMPVTPPNP